MMKHLLLFTLLAACSKDEPKTASGGSPDWGDDPRPLGSCVGVAKAGVEVPPTGSREVCLEKQTEAECTQPSSRMDYTYAHHTTCASRGYPKKCTGGGYPASARFKECPGNTDEGAAAAPPSPKLGVAKEAIAIIDQAIAAADETKTDCTAFGKKLDAIRGRLWDIGKEHPALFKSLSEPELKAAKAGDMVSRLTPKLEACIANNHVKEFAFAVTKLIGP